jgi:hypothetical protein
MFQAIWPGVGMIVSFCCHLTVCPTVVGLQSFAFETELGRPECRQRRLHEFTARLNSWMYFRAAFSQE